MSKNRKYHCEHCDKTFTSKSYKMLMWKPSIKVKDFPVNFVENKWLNQDFRIIWSIVKLSITKSIPDAPSNATNARKVFQENRICQNTKMFTLKSKTTKPKLIQNYLMIVIFVPRNWRIILSWYHIWRTFIEVQEFLVNFVEN